MGTEFPREIIQHIQSFLENGEAAETSLVSKSWFKAWSTRPTLSFEFDYTTSHNSVDFWDFVRKTIDRYIQLNLRLTKLTLKLQFDEENDVADSPVDQLILDALRLRVSVLLVDVINFPNKYVLPVQVFEHVYLTELVLFFCDIDVGEVKCSKLESLILGHVSVNNEMFGRILLGCPLIRELKMFGTFKGLTRMNVGSLVNLDTLFVNSYERISVEFEEKGVGLVKGGSRFVKMGILLLNNAEIDGSLFSTKFGYTFPNLEDLTLENCDGYRDIQISSKTMKFFNVIRGDEVGKLAVDVPNLIVFRFINDDMIPAMSSFVASKESKSEITLRCEGGFFWFQKLKDFLVKLGCINISLNVSIYCRVFDDDFVAPVMNVESPPVVENLESKCVKFSFFMGWLLWCCRPKLVTQTYYHDVKAVKVLYKKLVDQTVGTSSAPLIYDLKEVSVELFDESSMEWQRTEASADAWETLDNEGPELFRLRLTWGSLAPQEDTIIKFVADKPLMIPRGPFMMVVPNY